MQNATSRIIYRYFEAHVLAAKIKFLGKSLNFVLKGKLFEKNFINLKRESPQEK